MIGFVIVALVAVFQVISCQGPPPPGFPPNVPEQCRRPPQGVEKPHECCKIPHFFTDEDFQECGFKKLEDKPDRPGPHGPPDCSKQICIMEKYKLLNDGGSMNYEAVKEFMQKWGDSNEDWKPAMDTAIENCVGKPLPGPPHICEPNKIVFCVSSHMFANCAKWEDSDSCTKLKSHIEECSPFFPKP